MSLRVVVTDESVEFKILSLANEKGKFAVAVAQPLDEQHQRCFERGLDCDWYRLVDVSPIMTPTVGLPTPPTMRIFRLTESGFKRRAWLGQFIANGDQEDGA